MESLERDAMNDIRSAILQRFSCRTYLDEPLELPIVEALQALTKTVPAGPFGGTGRFVLLAASPGDGRELSSLGTYGFIQGANAYIGGIIADGEHCLEDFGWQMEWLVLRITAMGLGTCWLGGSFTRSTFAQKMNARIGEVLPAILSVGLMADEKAARAGLLRKRISADERLPISQLCFEGGFDTPLLPADEIEHEVLRMVRLGPSASNKQPWRIVRVGNLYHLYLQRTKGYSEGILQRFLGAEDLQRVDMGIAMCHFELTARQLGWEGSWQRQDPGLQLPNEYIRYTASWNPI